MGVLSKGQGRRRQATTRRSAPVKPGESRGELCLRAQLLADKVNGWEQEYRFHSTRQWRFDFAWPALKIAVEVEGGVHVQGRHNRGTGFVDDCEKYNEATRAGWRVYRFPTDQVERGHAIKFMKQVLSEVPK